MYIPREQRDILKALSLEVFGKSNRYQNLFEYNQVLTTKVMETVPGENGQPDTQREVEVPLLAKNTTKVKQSVARYRTVEEVITLLKEFKAKREEFLAKIDEQKAQEKANREAEVKKQQTIEELTGSAL